MDILEDKYIPLDIAKEILLHTHPKNIIPLCRSNKNFTSICRVNNFWDDYIINDQYRYNKLLLVLAEQGEYKLFKRLYTKYEKNEDDNNNTFFNEGKILYPAFELAFTNGHEDMAIYIWNLYVEWFHIKYPEEQYEKKTLEILLRQAVINNNKIFFEQLLLEVPRVVIYYNIAIPMSYSPSLEILEEFMDVAYQAVSISFHYEYLLSCATKIANFRLIREIYNFITGVGSYVSPEILYELLETNSPYSIKFIKDIVGNFDYSLRLSDRIGNKHLVMKFLDNVPEKEGSDILFASFKVFKPYEYAKLIIERMGCVTVHESKSVERLMLKEGYVYMAKIFKQEVPICGDKTGLSA